MTDKCATCINIDETPKREKCKAGVWTRQTTGFLETDESIKKLINDELNSVIRRYHLYNFQYLVQDLLFHHLNLLQFQIHY